MSFNSNLKEFITAYITCALWSSIDDNDEPMDSNYTVDDIDMDTHLDMVEHCYDFVKDNAHLIEGNLSYMQAGHDFWLTRNGHGAGFWDRGIGEAGEELSEAARKCGEYDLYIADDGKVNGA